METVLITEASSSIGLATAFLFCSRGWNVIAMISESCHATELSRIDRVLCVEHDVTRPDSAKQVVENGIAKFGRIDVVVVNSMIHSVGFFHGETPEYLGRHFDTSLSAVMSVAKAVLPHFREGQSGMFVGVFSAEDKNLSPVQLLCHSARQAIEGFWEELRYELKQFRTPIKLVDTGFSKYAFSSIPRYVQILLRESILAKHDDYSDEIIGGLVAGNADGADAMHTAACVYGAVNDGTRRFRYITSVSARLLWLLWRILPRMWFYRLSDNLARRPVAADRKTIEQI